MYSQFTLVIDFYNVFFKTFIVIYTKIIKNKIICRFIALFLGHYLEFLGHECIIFMTF